MVRVLVTGGIGSGKSAVCRVFAREGIPVYDSDARARMLYDTDAALLAGVVSLFGGGVLGPDGRVDRSALARMVFQDRTALGKLEELVHPAVYRDFRCFCNARSSYPLVAMESAIALQRGYPDGLFDEVIFVDAPLDASVARAAERDGRSREEIMERVAAQPRVAGDVRITRVIRNCGSLDAFETAAKEMIIMLKKEYNEDRPH